MREQGLQRSTNWCIRGQRDPLILLKHYLYWHWAPKQNVNAAKILPITHFKLIIINRYTFLCWRHYAFYYISLRIRCCYAAL